MDGAFIAFGLCMVALSIRCTADLIYDAIDRSRVEVRQWRTLAQTYLTLKYREEDLQK
jgi:hypothetical protein